MKYFKKIVGDRLYLSPMNEEDVEQYTVWLNDFSNTDGLGLSDKVTTINTEREFISSATKSGQYQFAIVLKENDTLIGNGGYSNINSLRQTGELGLFIGDEINRNKGYGSEALKLLVKYGFEYLNLNNIMLKVYSFNERAIQCYKKCGFKEFGRRHQVIPKNNTWYDDIYMEILKDDYFNKKTD